MPTITMSSISSVFANSLIKCMTSLFNFAVLGITCFAIFIVYRVAFNGPFSCWGWNGIFPTSLALSFFCLTYLWYWYGCTYLVLIMIIMALLNIRNFTFWNPIGTARTTTFTFAKSTYDKKSYQLKIFCL